jgi:hypothetical protein
MVLKRFCSGEKVKTKKNNKTHNSMPKSPILLFYFFEEEVRIFSGL